jgi:asparagine synthase (glutamine-hydrolysing)
MTRALAHRGPDGEGVEILGPAALGHRRLSIIDLSPAGRQPLSNEDGSVWITFNGEIYNFHELRAFLEAKGHVFRSRTDTECLVHLYEEEGEELVARLRGMFAFAIWDAKRRRLLLARDRAGEKPLHYRDDLDAFRFASEPLALHEDPSLAALDADPDALKLYLHYGYIPAPYSAWRGARKLPPAHLLVWESGKTRIRRYWQPRLSPKHDASTAAARARLEEECRARIDEATRLRMISDVPLGAFLSGGIDSSAVVSAMTRAGSGTVRTFTIGYDDRGYDERVYAQALAKAYATEHTERLVTPSAIEVLPVLVRRYGEPFADSSAIPTYYVAKIARERVTVALAGDGGDELFGGYTRYRANELFALYGRVPEAARSLLARMLWSFPPRTKPGDVLGLAQRFVRHFEKGRGPTGQGERNGESGFVLKRATVASLVTADFERSATIDPLLPYLEKYREADATDEGDRALYADLCVYMADDILTKVDIATMCHGLEGRAPLLDHPLMEWACRLPYSEKVRLRQTKVLLKRALKPLLPRLLLERGKRGFAVPIGAWFRGPLAPMLEDALLAPDARTRGLLERRAVERIVREHVAGKADWKDALWALLFLELWWRDVLEGSRNRRPLAAGASS